MREAGLGDVSSIEVVERLRLQCRWLERIIRDVGGGCRACSDCRYRKLIARLCEWRLVRVDVGMSWEGGVVENCCNKSGGICRKRYTAGMGECVDYSTISDKGG